MAVPVKEIKIGEENDTSLEDLEIYLMSVLPGMEKGKAETVIMEDFHY